MTSSSAPSQGNTSIPPAFDDPRRLAVEHRFRYQQMLRRPGRGQAQADPAADHEEVVPRASGKKANRAGVAQNRQVVIVFSMSFLRGPRVDGKAIVARTARGTATESVDLQRNSSAKANL